MNNGSIDIEKLLKSGGLFIGNFTQNVKGDGIVLQKNVYTTNEPDYEAEAETVDDNQVSAPPQSPMSDKDLRTKKAVEAGITDKNFNGGKDWALIRIALEEITGECFSSTTHFLRHMHYLGFGDLPTQPTIDRLYSKIGGNSQSGYRFGDGADAHVATIRTNIAKEVIGAYNKLG